MLKEHTGRLTLSFYSVYSVPFQSKKARFSRCHDPQLALHARRFPLASASAVAKPSRALRPTEPENHGARSCRGKGSSSLVRIWFHVDLFTFASGPCRVALSSKPASPRDGPRQHHTVHQDPRNLHLPASRTCPEPTVHQIIQPEVGPADHNTDHSCRTSLPNTDP